MEKLFGKLFGLSSGERPGIIKDAQTGAGPLVAEWSSICVAHTTAAVVTMPFTFEGDCAATPCYRDSGTS